MQCLKDQFEEAAKVVEKTHSDIHYFVLHKCVNLAQTLVNSFNMEGYILYFFIC